MHKHIFVIATCVIIVIFLLYHSNIEPMKIRFDNTHMKQSIEDSREKILKFLEKINDNLSFIQDNIKPKL